MQKGSRNFFIGVGELLVAINKMDTVNWSQQRYDELCATLKVFLRKQAGYSTVKFIPLSGLDGINLTKALPDSHSLFKWYQGPTLLQLMGERILKFSRNMYCYEKRIINTANDITTM